MSLISALLLGSTADDGTGDTLRDAGTKINDNFSALNQLFAVTQTASNVTLGSEAALESSNRTLLKPITTFNRSLTISDTPPSGNTWFMFVHNTGTGTFTLGGSGVTVEGYTSLAQGDFVLIYYRDGSSTYTCVQLSSAA